MKTHYSCAELSALNLPGYPGTTRAWRDVVERETWVFREVMGRGGKGGLRREYAPPERVAKLIASHQKIQANGAEARKTHYSCDELKKLRLPGYPTTRQGWYQLVKKQGWPYIDGRCKGGRNGGIIRLYELSKNLPSRTKTQLTQATVVALNQVRLEFLVTHTEAIRVLVFVAEMRAIHD